MLQTIEKEFKISTSDMRRISGDFRAEMERGLAGRKSSLKMIPSYVRRPTGEEKGSYIALDLGGTNFRIIALTLKGAGRSAQPKTMKFVLKKDIVTGPGEKMFDFLAASLRVFLRKSGIPAGLPLKLGFTFSFPVKQAGIASGNLVCWTKGFDAAGVVGKDVVMLFKDALARQELSNIEISALANDTVGTLVAKSYEDPDCDMGVIIGTGTNACYPEKSSLITKWKNGHGAPDEEMIINIEWGNFNKLDRNAYDRRLDRASGNPGKQILEKMVSGMYLGEIARLVLTDMAGKGTRFPGLDMRHIVKPYGFKTEEMSGLAAGKSTDPGIKAVLEMVSTRASRIAAACMAAIIKKMDPAISKKHTIAIDGSVYEKYPGFSGNVRKALRELFGAKARRIKTVLAKDGSGKGAAIIAAVA